MNRIALCVLLVASSARTTTAELIFIEKAAGSSYATGAEFNAIAGGLTLGSFALDTFTPDMMPAMDTMTATGPGATPATATHALMLEPDFAGSPAFFDSTFGDFSRSGASGQRATAEGHIEFKVDTFSSYMIDGFFSVDDVGTSAGTVELEIRLLDITAGAGSPTTIYSSYQKSIMTTDQMFGVDGSAGDELNEGFGAPAGMLDPSKHYAFKFLVNSLATDSTTAPATASGKLTFAVTAVPEPSCMTLLLFGSSVFMLRKRRQSECKFRLTPGSRVVNAQKLK